MIKKIIILLFITLGSMYLTCDDSSTELKLVISSIGDTFSGTYWADGGTAVDISGTTVSTNTYVYEGVFKNVDTLVVNVTKASGPASLYVYIYDDNDDLVQNTSLTANYPSADNPTLQLEVIYQKSGSTNNTTTE